MARAVTKCAGCGDVLWFEDSSLPEQCVVCPCGGTTLTEDGPEGDWEEPTPAETEGL